MSIVSYAQNFEDVLLWRALHDVQHGRYLDIGAQDPVYDSVSLAFYEAGWSGVHVEPTPFYAARLRDARPTEIVIEAAISQASGPLELHEVPGTGLSTGRAEIAERHARNGYETRTILVPTMRLDHLLDRVGEVHWMKVDVEGMEADVLESWGQNPVRPWLLIVEATKPNSQEPTHHQWRDKLKCRGYREVHFDGLSRYFVHEAHKERARAFKSPPNIFDDFKVTALHFATSRLAQSHADQLARAAEAKTAAESERAATSRQLEDESARTRAALEAANVASERAHAAERACLEAETIALQQAHASELAALQSTANTERVHREAIENMWAARIESENALREKWAMVEQRMQEAACALREDLAQALIESASLQERLSQQSDQCQQLFAECEASRRLLITASAEPIGRWQRLGQALGLAREDRARQLLRSRQHPSRDIEHPWEPPMSVATFHEARDYLQARSLGELLSLDDHAFVHSAYATILGRESDPKGEAYYLDRLKSGICRMRVLSQFRASPETRLFPGTLQNAERSFARFRLLSFFLGKQKAGTVVEREVLREYNTIHVDQFMQYFDEEFVSVLFKYYLEREADPSGRTHYTDRLRKGVSRQQILIDVAHSPEARKQEKRAAGQELLAARLWIDRIPIIGTLIAIARFNINIRRHLHDVRALQNHLYRLTNELS